MKLFFSALVTILALNSAQVFADAGEIRSLERLNEFMRTVGPHLVKIRQTGAPNYPQCISSTEDGMIAYHWNRILDRYNLPHISPMQMYRLQEKCAAENSLSCMWLSCYKREMRKAIKSNL